MSTIKSALALEDRMSRPMMAITKAMNSSLVAMRSIKGAELGPEYAQMAADIKLAEIAIDGMNYELQETPSATEKAASGFTVMKGVAVNAITTIVRAGKSMIQDFIGFGDEMLSISSRLEYLTGGAEAAAVANEEIFWAAQRARSGYDDMANSVTKLYTLAGESFGDIEQVIAFSEVMTKGFAAGQAGASEQQAAMM